MIVDLGEGQEKSRELELLLSFSRAQTISPELASARA
jgi:hypothetical protein